MNASPLRYFLVIGLHPRHNLAVLAAVTVVGLWTVTMSAGELDSALGMLLFVQMFLASTGFLIRARRGHFDPLLTSHGRIIVCVAHWCVSVLPVAIAWALVTGVDVAYGGSPGPALASRRLLALLIVSSVAWIAGFRFTRGSAGALWTAGLVAALLHRSDLLGAASTAPISSSLALILRHTAAVIVCPFLLLGPRPPLAAGSVAAAGSTTALALLAVWRSANHVDVYLRDRT